MRSAFSLATLTLLFSLSVSSFGNVGCPVWLELRQYSYLKSPAKPFRIRTETFSSTSDFTPFYRLTERLLKSESGPVLEKLAAPKSEVVGAFHRNKLVGFVVYQDLVGEVDLLDVLIDPEYSGKGAGVALFSAVSAFDFSRDFRKDKISPQVKKLFLRAYGDHAWAEDQWKAFTSDPNTRALVTYRNKRAVGCIVYVPKANHTEVRWIGNEASVNAGMIRANLIRRLKQISTNAVPIVTVIPETHWQTGNALIDEGFIFNDVRREYFIAPDETPLDGWLFSTDLTSFFSVVPRSFATAAREAIQISEQPSFHWAVDDIAFLLPPSHIPRDKPLGRHLTAPILELDHLKRQVNEGFAKVEYALQDGNVVGFLVYEERGDTLDILQCGFKNPSGAPRRTRDLFSWWIRRLSAFAQDEGNFMKIEIHLYDSDEWYGQVLGANSFVGHRQRATALDHGKRKRVYVRAFEPEHYLDLEDVRP